MRTGHGLHTSRQMSRSLVRSSASEAARFCSLVINADADPALRRDPGRRGEGPAPRAAVAGRRDHRRDRARGARLRAGDGGRVRPGRARGDRARAGPLHRPDRGPGERRRPRPRGLRRPRPRRDARGPQPRGAALRLPRSAPGSPGGASSRPGVAGGLDPGAIYALGEAIFAYIDELSAESAEGYAEEQSAAAGERQRLRRRLVRLLAQDAAPSEETILAAAAAAAWPLPRTVAALVTAPATGRGRGRQVARGTRLRNGGRGRGGHLGRDPRVVGRGGGVGCPRGAAGAAHRGGGDRGGASSGSRSCSCPTPARPPAPGASPPPPRGARRRSGPRCRSRSPGSRSAARVATHALLAEGRLGDRAFARAEEHLPALVIAADPALGAELAQQRLAPLADARRRPPRAPDRDAARVARPPRPGPGRRRRARRAPADRPLPRQAAARAVRRPARGPRGALRARARLAGGWLG